MNKFIYKTLLGVALTMPVLTSCELDQFPEGTIPAEKSWTSVEDANNFYIGLLSSLRSIAGSGVNKITEAQADMFNQATSTVTYNEIYDWTFTSSQFDGDGVWSGNYALISRANAILDNIDMVPVKNEEEQAAIDKIKGVAYFARAYGYSNLVTRYCKEYNEETANVADGGLPLVKTVDINLKPRRSTLEETYTFILEDIEKAGDLLPKMGEYTKDITVPQSAAILALKARVCLNYKKYDLAIESADSVIKNGDYALVSTRNFPTLWTADEGKEIIYQPLLTTDERAGGSMGSIFYGYNQSMSMKSASFYPTKKLMDLYETKDARYKAFFKKTDLCSGQYTSNGYIFAKFPGNPALRKANENENNAWYNAPKAFRTAELYLIAAECYYMKGDTESKAAALQMLNDLRLKRGATKFGEGEVMGDKLMTEIQNEWTREFCGEGFRLDGLKRWGLGIVRSADDIQNLDDVLRKTPGSYDLVIQPTDAKYQRIVWEIPSIDRQTNPNLKPNWE